MVGALFRFVAWFLVVTLVLLALMLALLNTSVGHNLIKQGLRDAVHPQLEVRGSMAIAVWPNLLLQADDVVIPQSQTSKEAVRIGQIRAGMSWLGLLDRVINIEQAWLKDVTLTSGASGSQALNEQPLFSPDAFERRWQRLNDPSQSSWQLTLDRLLIDNVELWHGQTRLASIDWAEVTVNVQINPVPLGDATLTVNGLRIDAQASETFQAALEQVGLGTLETLLVETTRGRWQLSDGLMRAVSWQANGPWGKVSADKGAIDLQTGEAVLPMRVQLKGQLSREVNGFSVQTRQADVRFVLVGPIDNLGIESPPN